MTQAAPEQYAPLRLVQGGRGELEMGTALARRFFGIFDDEFLELTAFVEGRIFVGHVNSEAEHVRALREMQAMRGFNGAYMLANGPLDPRLSARYEPGRVQRAHNGRATDKDITKLRALFVDCDPERPKGISATDDEKRAAWEVACGVRAFLEKELGREPVGFGSSGNGSFLLVALEPVVPTTETTARISRLLTLLHKKFAVPGVKIDTSVSNPARLMPAPGTWKRKGRDTPDRPHRMTTFTCAPNVVRVPLQVIA